MSAAENFMRGVEDMEALNVQLRHYLELARLAQARSWLGSLATCDAAMSNVQRIARQITEHAIDCQVEVGIEMGVKS